MANKKSRRKALPSLGLGSPDLGYANPVAELAAPSVPAGTVGAEVAMPMETMLAVEDDLGPEVAQGMSTTELAAYLDGRGLPYRWTMPRR